MLRKAIEFFRQLMEKGEPADDDAPDALPKPKIEPRSRSVAFIVSTGESDRQQITAALESTNASVERLSNAQAITAAAAKARPDVVFMGVAEGGESAMLDLLRKIDPSALGGAVQFVRENARVALEPFDKLAQERGVRSLPSLTSPVTREAIEQTIASEGLARTQAGAIMVDLGLALRNNWVEFWYQPKVDLARRNLVGAESLARIRHPTHGTLLPASFLHAPAADLSRLGLEAIRTAMRDWDAFHRLNFNLRLTVNVTVGATSSDRIVMLIETQPCDHGWPGLILDVDEADFVRSKQQTKAIQQALKAHGIVFAIDYVGASGSRAFEFAEVEFVELKIANRLTLGVSTSVAQRAACQSYIDFAHRSRALATAIGLETVPDAKALIELGCDLAQGTVFSPALQRAQFVNLLKRQIAPGSA